jgi:hypothetical protein
MFHKHTAGKVHLRDDLSNTTYTRSAEEIVNNVWRVISLALAHKIIQHIDRKKDYV